LSWLRRVPDAASPVVGMGRDGAALRMGVDMVMMYRRGLGGT
jgi:hypothetical protein